PPFFIVGSFFMSRYGLFRFIGFVKGKLRGIVGVLQNVEPQVAGLFHRLPVAFKRGLLKIFYSSGVYPYVDKCSDHSLDVLMSCCEQATNNKKICNVTNSYACFTLQALRYAS